LCFLLLKSFKLWMDCSKFKARQQNNAGAISFTSCSLQQFFCLNFEKKKIKKCLFEDDMMLFQLKLLADIIFCSGTFYTVYMCTEFMLVKLHKHSMLQLFWESTVGLWKQQNFIVFSYYINISWDIALYPWRVKLKVIHKPHTKILLQCIS
jgi:hypothetical protein